MTQVIEKNLAGFEDLAIGSGTVVQSRGGENVNITQIDTDWIFSTVAEVKSLDTFTFRHVIVISATNVRSEYDYLASSSAVADDVNVLAPDVGTGRWLLRSAVKKRTRQDFTDQDTTPNVDYNEFWRANNTVATSITTLDGGEDGQLVYLVSANANTTIVHSSSAGGINLKDQTTRTLASLEGLTLIRNSAGWWTEV